MTPTESAYMAGLIDGDGSIHIVKRDRTNQGKSLSFAPQIGIGGHTVHLETLHSEIRLGSVWVKKFQDGARHFAEWHIPGKQARKLLTEIYPYLRLKRTQAQLALEMPQCRSRWDATAELRAKQEAAWREVKRLNSRDGRGGKQWL